MGHSSPTLETSTRIGLPRVLPGTEVLGTAAEAREGARNVVAPRVPVTGVPKMLRRPREVVALVAPPCVAGGGAVIERMLVAPGAAELRGKNERIERWPRPPRPRLRGEESMVTGTS